MKPTEIQMTFRVNTVTFTPKELTERQHDIMMLLAEFMKHQGQQDNFLCGTFSLTFDNGEET